MIGWWEYLNWARRWLTWLVKWNGCVLTLLYRWFSLVYIIIGMIIGWVDWGDSKWHLCDDGREYSSSVNFVVKPVTFISIQDDGIEDAADAEVEQIVAAALAGVLTSGAAPKSEVVVEGKVLYIHAFRTCIVLYTVCTTGGRAWWGHERYSIKAGGVEVITIRYWV
jgi:hypothetical protein